MGRPKRRRGGGRVTPKGTPPRGLHRDDFDYDYEFHDRDYRYQARVELPEDPGAGFQLELLARDAEHMVQTCTDIDDADQWASAIQSAILSGWCREGVEASAVLSHAAQIGGPPGAVLAAAVCAYGPAHARKRARRVLTRLAEAGAEIPGWAAALGEAAPVRAARLVDRWGEHSVLVVDYERPDGSMHGLSVSVEPYCGGLAQRFSLGAAGASLSAADHPCLAQLNAAAAAHRRRPATDDGCDPGPVIEEVGLADARAVIGAGLRVYDEAAATAEDPDDLEDLYIDGDIDLRALLEQRIEMLPSGGRAPERPTPDAEEIAGDLGDFVSQPFRLGEHPVETGDLLRAMVGFAVNCRDRDILRWTPPRVTAFLEDWIPDHGIYCEECGESHEHPPDEAWLTTVESAFPRWLRFAAERSGLGADSLEENLAAARESLKQMRRAATGSPVSLA